MFHLDELVLLATAVQVLVTSINTCAVYLVFPQILMGSSYVDEIEEIPSNHEVALA